MKYHVLWTGAVDLGDRHRLGNRVGATARICHGHPTLGGSGGFLVEAARRVIDEGGIATSDKEGLDESLGAIVGGFLMEHGKLLVLMQLAELVIIFGAAVGTVLIGNPLPVVIKMAKMIGAVFGYRAKSRFSQSICSAPTTGFPRETLSSAMK